MEKKTVSKLDVARCQMNEAIHLFFEQRDPIAIHTLAAAAAQVLYDLCKARGIENLLRNTKLIRADKRKYWNQQIKALENFCKHADRDPDATHEFRLDVVETMIFDATHMYSRITERHTCESSLFGIWFFMNHPNWLLESDFKRKLMAGLSRLDNPEPDIRFFGKILAMKHDTGPRFPCRL